MSISKPLAAILALFLVAVMSLCGVFGIAYRSSKKESASKDAYNSSLLLLIETQEKKIESLSERSASSKSSWYVKIPVQMEGGTIAYREARGTASNESMVKEQVREAMSQFQQTIHATEAVTVVRYEKSESVTKRYPAAVGFGWCSDGRPWISGDGFLGSFGLGGCVGIYPKRGVKFIERGVVLAKYRF